MILSVERLRELVRAGEPVRLHRSRAEAYCQEERYVDVVRLVFRAPNLHTLDGCVRIDFCRRSVMSLGQRLLKALIHFQLNI